MRRIISGLLIVALTLLTACSGSSMNNPVEPSTPNQSSLSNSLPAVDTAGNHYLLGYWNVRILDDLKTIETTPVRTVEFHLNTVKFLEPGDPPSPFIGYSNVQDQGNNELTVDIRLMHPFPGLGQYDGFDVRGILITGNIDPADQELFDANNKLLPYGDNVTWLMYPEGYTNLFNPTDFPPADPGNPTIFEYIKGDLSIGEGFTGTLNPFMAYQKGVPRRQFGCTVAETLNWRIHYPDLPIPIEFGYAVDACWALPEWINDDWVFPPEANCNEAYGVRVVGPINLPLYDIPLLSVPMDITVLDHQPGTTAGIFVENSVVNGAEDFVPSNVPYLTPVDWPWPYYDSDTIGDMTTYHGWLSNWAWNDIAPLNADPYSLMVRVEDDVTDPFLPIKDAYSVAHNVRGVRLPAEGWAVSWGREYWYGNLARAQGRACSVFWNPVSDEEQIYVTGDYDSDDNLDLDPHPVLEDWHYLGSQGRNFLSCYNLDGHYQWGIDFEYIISEVMDMAVDSDCNACIVGIGGPGSYDFCKVNQAGVQLTRTWDCTSSFVIRSIVMDASDNIYVAGDFREILDLDPGAGIVNRSSNGGLDAFLIKLDPDANYEWGWTWGGTDNDFCYEITLGGGFVHCIGTFEGTVDFDPGVGVDEVTLLPGFDMAGYYSRFHADDGDYQPNVTPYMAPGNTLVNSVATSTQGYAYITGIFGFDSPNPRSFVVKLLPGGMADWLVMWPLVEFWNTHLATDPSGDVYLTGDFRNTVVFDPVTPIILTPLGNPDTFLMKLSQVDGDLFWVKQWGSISGAYPHDIDTDNVGNVYTAGVAYASPQYPIDFHLPPPYCLPLEGTAILTKNPGDDGNWF